MTEQQSTAVERVGHTPGPWRVDDHGFHKENGAVMDIVGKAICPHCRKPGNDVPVTMQILARGWGVAQLGSYEPKAEYAQHLANARLIAAAPELEEACALFTAAAHEVRDLLNGKGLACPSSIALAAEKARNALAKVEGRS